MVPAGQVLPGTLVFLECGCRGFRSGTPEDAPTIIVVEEPCEFHAETRGKRYLATLDQWEAVSPLTPFTKGGGEEDR